MLSLYDASIPTMIAYIGSLKEILHKAEEFSQERGTSPDSWLAARLHVTMFPLVFQVQMVTNSAKLLAKRVGGVETEYQEDNEKTMAELLARLDKTTAILEAVKKDWMDGDHARPIHVRTPLTSFTLSAQEYTLQYGVPNFFFHLVTAYNILRAQGVQVGKMDYACFETDPSGRLPDGQMHD